MPLPAREVMAVKLSTESLKRAVAAGFVVRATNLGVTTFIAPDNLLNQSALDKLRQVLPDEKLGNNQQYRIYRTATGVAAPAEADTEKPATPMQTPCGTDRCFGPSAINWKTEFRECARSVRIGVIDTGHDAKHPAFEKRTIETMQIAATERNKAPDWHGTGVLALLAGDTKSATPGLIPDAKFFLADIFYADAGGQPVSDTASLLEALEWLKTKHVKIVNLSLTGPPDDVLKEVLDDLSRNGMIIVAAAGNDGPTKQPRHPAAYPSVISVTAVSKDLRSYRFANRGERIDIAAPGVDIWTAMPGGRAGYHSGTSFAVPYVTAVLATVFRDLPEKSKSAFLDLATKEAKDLGDKGRDQTYGIGLLQAPATCQSRPVVAAVKAAPATPSLAKTLPSPTWPATVIQVRNQP